MSKNIDTFLLALFTMQCICIKEKRAIYSLVLLFCNIFLKNTNAILSLAFNNESI